jgi:hypothetical protein
LTLTFLFTLFLNLIIGIPIFLVRFNSFNLHFFSCLFIISAVSLLSLIFRSLGLYQIDIKGRILASFSCLILFLLVKFSKLNINIIYFIILPYLINLLYYIIKILKTKLIHKNDSYNYKIIFTNIKMGYRIYIMNIALLSLSMLDKFVFNKSFNKIQLSLFYLSLSISSIHTIFQTQINNMFYERFLSNINSLRSSIKIVLFSLTFNLSVSFFIFLFFYLGGFEILFPKYDFNFQFLVFSEFIANMNALIGLLFLILIGQKLNKNISYFVLLLPILIYTFFELNLLNNHYYWFIVYLIILIFLVFKYIQIYLKEL